ncbi:class I SAM-dependent methyltransferase [Natranaerobius thermophilus]|uniref:class I SAM-dependent methyltransferase n=1 Tax=Natranaerobius thermophilus TaxID=375929 RepID=UPI002F4019B3
MELKHNSTKLFGSLEKISCLLFPCYHFYCYLYKSVVKNEIKLGQITSEDKVLNIGCGAIPFTAIHIAKLTGAEVIAVDRDLDTIEKAKYYLNYYCKDLNISFKQSDASIDVPNSFDVAIVALQVNNKASVFENLYSKSKEGGRLIFREPPMVFQKIYDSLPTYYKATDKVEQRVKTIRGSILYNT